MEELRLSSGCQTKGVPEEEPESRKAVIEWGLVELPSGMWIGEPPVLLDIADIFQMSIGIVAAEGVGGREDIEETEEYTESSDPYEGTESVREWKEMYEFPCVPEGNNQPSNGNEDVERVGGGADIDTTYSPVVADCKCEDILSCVQVGTQIDDSPMGVITEGESV